MLWCVCRWSFVCNKGLLVHIYIKFGEQEARQMLLLLNQMWFCSLDWWYIFTSSSVTKEAGQMLLWLDQMWFCSLLYFTFFFFGLTIASSRGVEIVSFSFFFFSSDIVICLKASCNCSSSNFSGGNSRCGSVWDTRRNFATSSTSSFSASSLCCISSALS